MAVRVDLHDGVVVAQDNAVVEGDVAGQVVLATTEEESGVRAVHEDGAADATCGGGRIGFSAVGVAEDERALLDVDGAVEGLLLGLQVQLAATELGDPRGEDLALEGAIGRQRITDVQGVVIVEQQLNRSRHRAGHDAGGDGARGFDDQTAAAGDELGGVVRGRAERDVAAETDGVGLQIDPGVEHNSAAHQQSLGRARHRCRECGCSLVAIKAGQREARVAIVGEELDVRVADHPWGDHAVGDGGCGGGFQHFIRAELGSGVVDLNGAQASGAPGDAGADEGRRAALNATCQFDEGATGRGDGADSFGGLDRGIALHADGGVVEVDGGGVSPAACGDGDGEHAGGGIVKPEGGTWAEGDGARADEGACLAGDVQTAVGLDAGGGEGATEVEGAVAVDPGGAAVVVVAEEDDGAGAVADDVVVFHRHRRTDDEVGQAGCVCIGEDVGIAEANEESRAARTEAVGIATTSGEGGRVIETIGTDAIGGAAEVAHAVTECALIEGLGVGGVDGEDGAVGIDRAGVVIGGGGLDAAGAEGAVAEGVEGVIGSDAEDAVVVQVTTDCEGLTGLDVACAVEQEAGGGVDDDLTAELGGGAEVDPVAVHAAEVGGAACAEDGAAGVGVGSVDEEVAARAFHKGAVAADHSVEGQAGIILEIHVTGEGGGSVDPVAVSVGAGREDIGAAEHATDHEVVHHHGFVVVVGHDAARLEAAQTAGDECIAGNAEQGAKTNIGIGVGGHHFRGSGAVTVGAEEEAGTGSTRVDFNGHAASERVGGSSGDAGIERTAIDLPGTDTVLASTGFGVGEDNVIGTRLGECVTAGIDLPGQEETATGGADDGVLIEGGGTVHLDKACSGGDDRCIDGKGADAGVLGAGVEGGGHVGWQGDTLREGCGGDREVITIHTAP